MFFFNCTIFNNDANKWLISSKKRIKCDASSWKQNIEEEKKPIKLYDHKIHNIVSYLLLFLVQFYSFHWQWFSIWIIFKAISHFNAVDAHFDWVQDNFFLLSSRLPESKPKIFSLMCFSFNEIKDALEISIDLNFPNNVKNEFPNVRCSLEIFCSVLTLLQIFRFWIEEPYTRVLI